MSRWMLCGVVSWILLASPTPARADDAEEKAVAVLTKLGGGFLRDGSKPGNHVTSVSFAGPKLSGADLRALAPLQHLTVLTLVGTSVSDEDLKELAAFPNLTELNLNGAKITGEGFAALSGLRKLAKLILLGTNMTDAGLRHVAQLPNLTELTLICVIRVICGSSPSLFSHGLFLPGGAGVGAGISAFAPSRRANFSRQS